jgi:putative phosphoribosyl transferase
MAEEQQGKIHHIVRIPVPAPENEKEALKIVEGDLTIPSNNRNTTKGIVLFAHGSGSSSYSTRNQFVAKALNNDGLATLLVDLLTPQEEESDIRMQKIQSKIPGLVLNKFNIKLLSKRLTSIMDWILANADTQSLIIGLFGSSTGAAAALIAAGQKTYTVSAIVSRSGRTDLASQEALNKVQAPTLLIVGGNDDKSIIDINNKALNQLVNLQKKKVVIVPGATHLFEEPGMLEEVARLASGWFRCYFLIKEHEMGRQQSTAE